jgi:hypothetical protein
MGMGDFHRNCGWKDYEPMGRCLGKPKTGDLARTWSDV